MDACQLGGVECELQFTRYPGHAAQLAVVAWMNGYQRIVAVGGDGTVNEVVQSLAATDAVLGILPLGSGNGLARHLGISMDLGRALQQLLTAKVVSIDVFNINDRLAANVAGIGFDGHVASQFGKNGKRGLWNYVRIALREFWQFQPFSFSMNPAHPGQDRPAFMLVFANSSQFGNGARIAPEASVRDGWIDVVAVPSLPARKFMVLAFQGWLGFHNRKLVPSLRIKRATIEIPEPVSYHVDGEPCPPARLFSVAIMPNALQVLVPREAAIV